MNIDALYDVICDRLTNPKTGSYTVSLLQQGEDEILKKVGEEAVEVILAAKDQGRQRVIEEVADLTYHVLVLLAAQKIRPEEVRGELSRRHK
jgi:phosphoribosyl-ATP pyrophosphohydrolase